MGTEDFHVDDHVCEEASFEGNYDSREERRIASTKVQGKPSWKGSVSAKHRTASLTSSNDSLSVKGEGMRNTVESEPVSLMKIELDAALALADFSRISYLPSSLDRPCEAAGSGLQWFAKRKRSVRVSSELRKLEENVEASSIDGKRLPPAAHGQFDKELFSNGRFGSKKSSAEKLRKHKTSVSAGRMDEQERSFLTESSKESTPPDCREDSPSSPLPSLQVNCRAFFGGSSANSAFQKVIPMRPGQKPQPLSIESEAGSVDCKVEKHMKTRPTKVAAKRKALPRKPLLQTFSVKVEERVGPSPSTLVYQENRVSPNPFKSNTRSISHSGPAEAAPMSISTPVKAESRQVGTSLRLPKATHTEMEKEARRLRRMQANRKSARQTIRRKQALCEELTERAASLTVENEVMKKRREELFQEICTLCSTNRHLKEQLVTESGNSNVPESPTVSSLPFSLATVQVPMFPHAGTPLQSFFWAFALARSAAASKALGLQSGEIASNMDQYPFSNAKNTATATAAYNVLEAVESQTALSHQREPQQGSESASNSSLADHSQLSVADKVPTLEGVIPSSVADSPACTSDNKVPMLEQVIHSSVGGSPACTSRHSNLGLENSNMQLTRTEMSHAIPSNSSLTGGSLEGPSQTYLFTRNKLSEVVAAAAEARRRRKELTRSKVVHSRPFRLHC